MKLTFLFLLIGSFLYSQNEIKKSDLYIRVYPKDAFLNSLTKDSILYQILYSDLLIVPGINYEDRIKLVTQSDLNKLNIATIDTAFKISIENSINSIGNLKFETIDLDSHLKYYFVYDENNLNLNAILFSPQKLSIPNKLGLIFGIPTKETITVLPIDSKADFQSQVMDFFEFNSQIYENNGIKTTKSLFLYRNGKVYEIIPTILNDQIKLMIPKNIFD